jgi:hypothetical protein
MIFGWIVRLSIVIAREGGPSVTRLATLARSSFFIAIAYRSHNSALLFRVRDLPGTGRTLCIS